MRFRSRITALCALLALSAMLAVAASARATVPTATLLASGQAVAPPSAGRAWSEEMRPTGGFRLRHPLGLLAASPLS